MSQLSSDYSDGSFASENETTNIKITPQLLKGLKTHPDPSLYLQHATSPQAQKDILIILTELAVNTDSLPTHLSATTPFSTNQTLFFALIIKNKHLFTSENYSKLLKVVLPLPSCPAKIAFLQIAFQSLQSIDLFKSFLKLTPLNQSSHAAAILNFQDSSFILKFHSSVYKQLISHINFCQSGKGTLFWSGQKASKMDKSKSGLKIELVFNDKIMLILQLLIVSANTQELEFGVSQIIEQFTTTMIHFKTHFAAILKLYRLMSKSFTGYFSIQNQLINMFIHTIKPLPYAAFTVNINQYRGKMFDQNGKMKFFETLVHPKGLVDSSFWHEQLQLEIVKTLVIYYQNVCGFDKFDAYRLICLPEASNWLISILSQVGEALAGGCIAPGFNVKFSFGKVQKSHVPVYQKEIKRIRNAIVTDCDAIKLIRSQADDKELDRIFVDGYVTDGLQQKLRELRQNSEILKLSIIGKNEEGQDATEMKFEPIIEDQIQQPEEEFEAEEQNFSELENNPEGEDIVRELKL
ncbi:hypothetical protein SS50377_26570 [Spironucleus salmonicida]|uniref:Uncharacterized protein n=1 Tax=Spironucleus salmonicida TaxID=348837 RepID=V6LL68_9EUKA|nr:hypothetical protein SS50377_26570 [Spironucleus salmonicida]|eukprot:EST41424.1 Hypothetical protein SS50377_19141 [Spironucleus salmonicida]